MRKEKRPKKSLPPAIRYRAFRVSQDLARPQCLIPSDRVQRPTGLRSRVSLLLQEPRSSYVIPASPQARFKAFSPRVGENSLPAIRPANISTCWMSPRLLRRDRCETLSSASDRTTKYCLSVTHGS